MAYAKIRPRRGTEYEFSVYNPVLANGEIVLVYPDSGIGTGLSKFKVGDGVTDYVNLPYAFDGTAANSINGGTPTAYSVIQIRAADTATWSDINPVLNENEIIYDKTVNSFKVGDGVNRFDDLPYINSNSITDDMDFGDEGADVSVGAENKVLNNNYPERALPEDWKETIGLEENDSEPVGEDDPTGDREEETVGIEDLLESEDDIEDGGSED